MATSSTKHLAKPASKATVKVVKSDNVPIPPGPESLVPVEGMPTFRAVQLDKRYVPARLPTGKVMEVWGDALIRTPEGEVRQLVPGDEIKKGDVILTAQNGIVQMEADGSRFARQPFGADLQGPLAQVNATDDFDAPGAGLGDIGGLGEGMRIDRVVEGVTAQTYQFDGAAGLLGNGPFLVNGLGGGIVDAGNLRPVVDLQSILVPESGGVVIAGGVQAAAVAGSPGFAVFTVHLDIPAVEPVPVALKLTAETAAVGTTAQGGDFGVAGDPTLGMQVSIDDGQTWQAGNSVIVPVGQTQALVRVPVSDDGIDEFDESFRLTATRTTPAGVVIVLNAVATIVDNDPAPGVTTSDVTVNEGAGTATFTLTLSSVSGKPISVDWSTGDGTGPSGATAGQDYTAGGGTVTFLPGETTKTVTVAILDDKLVEAATEQFVVNLSNGVNVDLTTAQVRGLINDDDHAPTLVHQTPAAQNEDVVQTGNLLTGATDQDQDPVTIVNFTVGTGTPSPAGTPVVVPGVGTVVIQPDGGYTFTPAPNYDGAVPPITYTASDGANQVTDTVQLVITPVNDAPAVAAITGATVSELGLAASNTSLTTTTGTVQVSDVEGDALTVRLSGPSIDVTVSGGARTVVWTGTGTAGDPLLGTVDSKEYVRATIDDSGHYTVELKAAIDAPASGTLDLGVVVSDGFQPVVPGPARTVTGTLSVTVVDDAPTVASTQTTVDVSRSSSDLLLILDTSGSMSTPDGVGGTRLGSAIAAFQQLLADYAAQGDVHVRIVTFSDNAAQHGNGWLTVDQALTVLAGITKPEGNNTNYAAAITAAMDAYGSGSGTAGAKSLAYFLSDGLPTSNQAISGAQQTQWEQFLVSKGTKAVAVGFGDFQNNSADSIDPDAARGAMAPIAYDGGTQQQTSTNLVGTAADLNTLLESTVPPPVQGYLAGTSTSTGAAGGADHAYIATVTVDGKVYSFNGVSDTTPSATGAHQFDAATHVLTITTTNHGTLSIDMDDGRYGYQPPPSVPAGYADEVRFTVADRDGDVTATNQLFVNVTANATVGGAATHATTTLDVNTALVSPLSATSATSSASADIQHATPLADVFSWQLADAGAPGSPSTTHITDFGIAPAHAGGDVLDLRDLLLGEMAAPQGGIGNLGHYLDFSTSGSGAQALTTIQVSTHGGFDGSQAAATLADKVIVLDGMDLRGSLGLDAHAANQQIIETLLQQGKLATDGSSA